MQSAVQPMAVPQTNAVIYNPHHGSHVQYQNNVYNPYGLNHAPMQQIPATVAVTPAYHHGTQEQPVQINPESQANTTDQVTKDNTETKSVEVVTDANPIENSAVQNHQEEVAETVECKSSSS